MKYEGITLELGVNTSKLQSAMKEVNSAASKTERNLRQVQTALKFNPGNLDLLRQKQEQWSNKVAETKDKLEILKQQLAALPNGGKDALGNTTEEFDKLQREIIKTESQLESYEKQLDAATRAAEQGQTPLESLNTTIGKQESELKELKSAYANAVLQYGKNSDEANKLAGEIEGLSTELAENKRSLSDAEDAADQFDKSLDGVADGSDHAGSCLTAMKVAAGALAAEGLRRAIDAAKDFVVETIEVGQNFDSAMSNVAALSGATGDELQMLRDTAKDFGSTTKFSASEAADALGFMALAGWDANTSASALGGVLDLAAASGMDLGAASDMVTDYLSAFNLSADKSSYFADLLAYAQANANTTAQGLGEAYKNCAANMNAAGQDIETTTSLLSMMANQGLKGSEAGTALTAVMRDMTAKMKDGAIKIGDTSVAVMDANGNYRDMTDVLTDVESAVGGMGDAERATALQSTFTSDSIKGLNLLLNAGVGEAAAFEEQLRNSTGSAKDMADVMQNNLGGDLTSLGSQFEGVQIAMYEKFEPALRSGVDVLAGLLDGLSWVIDHGEQVGGVIMTIGGAIGGLAVYNAVCSGLANGFNIMTTATKGLDMAQQFLNNTLRANPLGIVITLITGIVSALAWWFTQTEEGRAAWEGFCNFITEKWEAFTGWFGEKIQEVQGFFDNLGEGIGQWRDDVCAFWQGVADDAHAKFEDVKNTVQNEFQQAQNIATGASNVMKDVLTGDWKALSTDARQLWSDVDNSITSHLQAAKDSGIPIVSDLASGALDKWNWLKTDGVAAFGSLASGISDNLNKAKDWANEKAQGIVDFWSSIPDDIIGFFTGIGSRISNAFGSIHFPSPHVAWDNLAIAGFQIPIPDVKWYSTGGIFSAAQVIGVGEAGSEAVMPLDKLPELMAEAIQLAGGTGGGTVIVENMNVRDESDIKGVAQELYRLGKRSARAKGAVYA